MKRGEIMGVRIVRRGKKVTVETWGNADPIEYVKNIDWILNKMDEYGANEFRDDRDYTSVYDASPMMHDVYFSEKNYKK